jgi:hypothetical protein
MSLFLLLDEEIMDFLGSIFANFNRLLGHSRFLVTQGGEREAYNLIFFTLKVDFTGLR